MSTFMTRAFRLLIAIWAVTLTRILLVLSGGRRVSSPTRTPPAP